MNCRLALLLTSGTLIGLGAWAAADTYPRAPQIDILDYAFRLSLSDTIDEIVGDATVELRCLADGVTAFELDLVGIAPASAGRGMTVSSVTSSGVPLPFTHQNDRLRIVLPAPSKAGDRFLCVINYHGVPAAGLRIGPNRYGERTFFSDNWPNKARHWLPMIDHPYDKATVQMIVTAPAHYQVISNGQLVEQTDLSGNLRRTHWKQPVPISSWLCALGVARFAVQHLGSIKGVPLETWVYGQDRDAGFRDFATPVGHVVEFLSERIGPYPYPRLANVQAAGIGGGMELATAIFYGEGSVKGEHSPRLQNVVVHEVAHQWFGDSVTERDWDDVWLSEGFATYFTLLFTEHASGRDALVDGLIRARQSVLEFDEKNPTYRVVHDNLTDMEKVLSHQIYEKGAWTLHMLRGVIGDDAFWTGIREYYRRYRDANASTDEFRRVMEEASGQELAWFFRQWLYRGGRFQVRGGWRYDPRTKQVKVDLDQVQNEDLFRMPVEIGLTFDRPGNPRVERVIVSERHHTFVFSADKAPTSIVLDPGTWVLMDAQLAKR